MSRYHELAEVFVEYALELQEDLTKGRGFAITAASHLMRAAELLLELDVGPELAAEVRALQALCICGHDRGDHLVAPPHICEAPGCLCVRFEARRVDTLPDLMTDPAPAPPTEVA